jgi:16S rRNA (cytosine1402-N4)-methyltransferase
MHNEEVQYHEPVLLQEIIELLQVDKGKRYIDATLGDGGHTIEFLKRGALVLGLDYDEKALARATDRIKSVLNGTGFEQNFTGVNTNFKNIDVAAKDAGFDEVDGILYDLGYSTSQLEETSVGLSFLNDQPLDMRLDKNLGVTAADLVNTLGEKQLEKLFLEYGEERLAKRFARRIVDARKLKQIQTTTDLSDLLVDEATLGYEKGRIHPATRVFQALRIVVNDELENLKSSLPRAAHLLKLPGGRMGIISFHSLEDRVAKSLKNFSHNVRPAINLGAVNKKPITPGWEEVKSNKKARSAKLRVYERIN